MNDREKIEELENQIKMLKTQVSALKSAHRIDWAKYYMFGDGKWDGGLCYFSNGGIPEKTRALALRIMSIYEEERNDGTRYIWADKQVHATKLTKAQAGFVNGFIDEIYPTVEKYALIALNGKEKFSEDDTKCT